MTIGAEIASLALRLAALRLRQGAETVAAIRFVIGPGVAFSARELWAHRAVNAELAAAFADAGIRNARQLGKRLEQLRGAGIARIGDDRDGAIWIVE